MNMDIKGFRPHIIIMVALLSFLLFFGGKFFYHRYLVLDPVLKEVRAFEGVEEVQVLSLEDKRLFEVRLADVEDLAGVYGEINDRLETAFGEGGYILSLRDRRSRELEEAYHLVHFALFESIARGNFTHLAAVVEEVASARGLGTFRVSVDSERVYLQFHSGDAYLYEVVPRTPTAGWQS
jgi:hypothetical protein